MDNLLKEAIADAKAVRETALENAKIALEEAFTPRLQSMLSKKIQSEMEKEGEHEDEEDVDERMHDEDEDDVEEMRLKAQDEDPSDEDSKDEAMHDEDEDEVDERMKDEDENEVEERMHDEDEDEKKDEAMHDEDEDEDEDEMDEDLDLDEILKELEAEAMHDEDEDDVEERMKDEDEDEEDKVDENDVSSAIGSADNKVDKKAGDSTDIGNADKAKHTESVDEDIDLDEVLKALSEEDEEEEEKESTDEVSKLESELAEHRDVVKYLRTKLNEVNLLNAKLLFTNKLFRAFGLSNDQKMKVVETFDRATNLREVKLVYSTLAESFGTKVEKKEIKESKGSASKAVASTKSKKQEEILSEGGELRNRFKKLAGII
jgi:hypothetical protein